MNDDEEVLRRARMGEESALVALYTQYRDPIYRYLVCRVGGDTVLAEELTAQLFERLVVHIHGLQWQNRPILTWLYTVARHLVTDHYREQKKLHWTELTEIERSDEPSPEAYSVEKWEQSQLLTALKQLTTDQQEVLIWRFVDEMSVTDTAERMGRQEGAVKTLTRRALASLRRLLEGTI